MSNTQPYGPVRWGVYEIEFDGLQDVLIVTIPFPVDLPADLVERSEEVGVLRNSVNQKIDGVERYKDREWRTRSRTFIDDDTHRAMFPDEPRPDGYE